MATKAEMGLKILQLEETIKELRRDIRSLENEAYCDLSDTPDHPAVEVLIENRSEIQALKDTLDKAQTDASMVYTVHFWDDEIKDLREITHRILKEIH